MISVPDIASTLAWYASLKEIVRCYEDGVVNFSIRDLNGYTLVFLREG